MWDTNALETCTCLYTCCVMNHLLCKWILSIVLAKSFLYIPNNLFPYSTSDECASCYYSVVAYFWKQCYSKHQFVCVCTREVVCACFWLFFLFVFECFLFTQINHVWISTSVTCLIPTCSQNFFLRPSFLVCPFLTTYLWTISSLWPKILPVLIVSEFFQSKRIVSVLSCD